MFRVTPDTDLALILRDAIRDSPASRRRRHFVEERMPRRERAGAKRPTKGLAPRSDGGFA
ncbi:MAG: hypothetical protein H0U65_05950 [Rubrobacter sp.]|nr:hypothetical protein [Rubrobacter sp.]